MNYSNDGKDRLFRYDGYTESYKNNPIKLDANLWSCRFKNTFEEVTEDFLKRFSDRILGGY